MNRRVKVLAKSAYGRDLIYPANEPADIFTKLSGRPTLTLDTLYEAERLGFKIIAEPHPNGGTKNAADRVRAELQRRRQLEAIRSDPITEALTS